MPPAPPDADNLPNTRPSGDLAGEAEGPQVFSLPQAVEFALHNSPRLRSAFAAIEQAKGQEQVAFAPFLPQIDMLAHGSLISPTLGPAPTGFGGIVLASGTSTRVFSQAELELQWTLCDFGRRQGWYQQAEARTQIAKLQFARAKETVRYDVASAYMQALRAAAIRVIQEEAVPRAEATLRDTRSRRAAGVAERDDVLRGEVQLSMSRDAVDIAREEELAALARLNNFMGRNAALPIQLIDWPAPPDFALSLVQCLEAAAEQRQEIGVARESVASAEAGRNATAADFRPRIYAAGMFGGVGGRDVVTGLQEGGGLHFAMPLYAGGRRQGNLRAADAEVRVAMANAQSILDAVSLEVTLGYRAAVTAQRRIGRLQPAVIEAAENLRLVRNRYRNGNATPTDIVDAETTLTGAQQRLSSARYEFLSALVRLDYALGNAEGSLLCAASDPVETLPEPRKESE